MPSICLVSYLPKGSVTYVPLIMIIHTAQIKEIGYLPFYIIYVIEWLVRMIQFRGHGNGYRNISFEREAYHNDDNLDYTKTRKHYAFLKYIRKA